MLDNNLFILVKRNITCRKRILSHATLMLFLGNVDFFFAVMKKYEHDHLTRIDQMATYLMAGYENLVEPPYGYIFFNRFLPMVEMNLAPFVIIFFFTFSCHKNVHSLDVNYTRAPL